MSLLTEGQQIRGTYEVEELLGEGAFGEVYRVKHLFLGRLAMKVFKLVGQTTQETLRILGEPLLLSKMSHPNIIRIFEANTTETSKGTCSFFTMEYVAGGTLDKFWRSHGQKFVPLETTVDLVTQICRGLAVAHAEGIIHRDIKPQNILVGYDATGLRARICDFGLAKKVNPLTLAATAAGTLPFKPPEIFSDSKSDSTTGDVWSVGVVLYLLLTDRFPYAEAGEEGDRSPRRFERPLAPAARFNCLVDSRLDTIITRALNPNPKSRFRNAQEFLSDLEKWTPQPPKPICVQTPGSDASKSALGFNVTSQNQEEANRMASRALTLAQQAAHLQEAADLMEEAFNKWPDIREKYANKLRLWRCGIVTPSRA